MLKTNCYDGKEYGQSYFLVKTVTVDTLREFIEDQTYELSKVYDEVSVSPAIPIIVNNILCYTVTLKASNFIK